MKTIVEINNNNYGSTGNIMINIARKARKNGFIVYTCCKNSKTGHNFYYDNQIFIGIWLERIISNLLCYITSLNDSFNIFGTLLFIKKLNKIKPDIIHLHNIHGSFINISIFFNYISKKNIPIVWTFHDTWPLTGQCASFLCNKWKNGCGNCPQLHDYPKSLFLDFTKYKLNKKKKLINKLHKLTIISPSIFLYNLIEESYLKKYKHVIINNGINLNIFKYNNKTEFRYNYNINKDDFCILSVANFWNYSKGLDVLINLAKELPKKFKLIIVGTNDNIDNLLPKNIISIHRTDNIQQLVDIYSSCDLFVNPTRNENFPTVNIEALACGLPVLTYNSGGSKEIIDDTCGAYVEKNDFISLLNKIIEIEKTKPYNSNNCIKRSYDFDMNNKFNDYISLYNTIIK